MGFLVCTTTFLKNEALKLHLESLIEGTKDVTKVVICDDASGHATPVFEEYNIRYKNNDYPFPIVYITGENRGIAINKNRGIKYFLEESNDQFLCLLDDDISLNKSVFGSPTIFEEFESSFRYNRLPAQSGFLDDYNDPLSNKGFLDTFPPFAEDEYVIHCTGGQGICLFYTRLAIESVGYMDVLPGKYGFEHSLHNLRVNRTAGRFPEDYTLLKRSYRYIRCLGIENNYKVDPKGLEKNQRMYLKRKEEIYKGTDLKVMRW